jgi:hypothetical protein
MSVRVIEDRADKMTRYRMVNILRRGGIEIPNSTDVPKVNINLMDLARETLVGRGFKDARYMDPGRVATEIFRFSGARAANSSGDLPSLLSNVQNKALIAGYREAKATWPLWCKRGNLNDFKTAKRVDLTDFAALRETGENGEILDSKLGDRGEDIQLGVYARRTSFTWEMLVNDDTHSLVEFPRRLGRSAKQLPSRLVCAHLLANPIMGDGVPLFHEDHGNLLTGATSNLDQTNKVTAVVNALKAFRQFTAPKAPNDTEFPSEPVDVEPRVLLVPPEHEYAAYQVANPNLFVTETQHFANRFEVATEQRLSNSGYTGYSATAWYLVGGPESDVMEVAFLNGDEEPMITSHEDFNALALQTRCVLACGVKALTWRGIVKSEGS